MSPETKIADAIRDVTVTIQNLIDSGKRSAKIDAHDLIETLLAIADRLESTAACPTCCERDPDRLIWQDDRMVRCASCGTTYQPGK